MHTRARVLRARTSRRRHWGSLATASIPASRVNCSPQFVIRRDLAANYCGQRCPQGCPGSEVSSRARTTSPLSRRTSQLHLLVWRRPRCNGGRMPGLRFPRMMFSGRIARRWIRTTSIRHAGLLIQQGRQPDRPTAARQAAAPRRKSSMRHTRRPTWRIRRWSR